MVCVEKIKAEYPLHWLVWNNEFKSLEIELSKKEVIAEKLLTTKLSTYLRLSLSYLCINHKILLCFWRLLREFLKV